jgi:hypothetical protein
VRDSVDEEIDIDSGIEWSECVFDEALPSFSMVGENLGFGHRNRLVTKSPARVLKARRLAGTASTDDGVVLGVELEVYRSEEFAI